MERKSSKTVKEKEKKSTYFQSLNDEKKEKYSKKLQLLDLIACPSDSLIPDDEWKHKVTLWPPLEYGDVYNYLTDTPKTFTKEKLKAYKSFEAYNYYRSGHVQTVYYHSINSNLCILKRKVNTSQRSPSLAHEA